MQFTKSYRHGGGYTTDFVSEKSGRTFRVFVAKREVGNPSARGGAYRTEWAAKFGDRIATGDTRGEAVAALVDKFARDNIILTPKEES